MGTVTCLEEHKRKKKQTDTRLMLDVLLADENIPEDIKVMIRNYLRSGDVVRAWLVALPLMDDKKP